MIRAMRSRLAFPVAITMVVATACGGGDSSTDETTSDDTVAAASDGSVGNGSEEDPNTAEGETINGLVVSLLSPELGLYAIDRATDDVRDLTMDGVEFTHRQQQPILVGDTVFMLTATTIEGQFSASNLGIGRVDLDTGVGTEIVQIGPERENDEDPDLIEFELIGGDATTIWVTREPFAMPDEATYLSFDSSTGDARDEFQPAPYEVTTESGGTCSGDVRNPIVLSDGTLVGVMGGWPATIDPASGEVEPLVTWCDFDTSIDLSDLIAPEELDAYTVTESGNPIPDDQALRILEVIDPTVSNGIFTEGGGSLWWVFSTNTAYTEGDESVSAHVGGIVEFDLATDAIINVWPLGDGTVKYSLGDDDGADLVSVSVLSQADLRFLDSRLWIMDWRENAPLRVLDPAAGALTSLEIERGDGVDFTTASLISSDPHSIWLEVSRSTITSEDGESRSALGIKSLDQFDPSANTFTSSIDVSSIIGF